MRPPRVDEPCADGMPAGPLRLPRDVESDPCHEDVRRVLAARTRKLWSGGTLEVAVVPSTAALRKVLCSPSTARQLQRGLEAATATLASEQRGLAALPPAVTQGRRVSRVLLVTNDGAERFYRQVERLAITHAPRVLVCVIDCDSAGLGELLYGSDGVVKLVLTGHKTAAARILRALAGP